MPRRLGATSSTPINPDDFSGDSHYGHKPLSYHASRAIADHKTERQSVRRALRRAA